MTHSETFNTLKVGATGAGLSFLTTGLGAAINDTFNDFQPLPFFNLIIQTAIGVITIAKLVKPDIFKKKPKQKNNLKK